MSGLALSYSGVAVRYVPEGAEILSDVSFALAPGERAALLGLNGTGKTTLLLATAGLLPHSGEIRVGEHVLGPRTLDGVRAELGYLFNLPEDQLLFPRVVDDVAFALLRRGVSRTEAADRARAALARLGAEPLAEQPVHRLSHGQKQRVALAGALVTEPSLLLLDEPWSGLDPPAKRRLCALLEQIPAALLVATHDLDLASRLCSRFVLLDEGRVALDATEIGPVRERWEAVG